MSRELSQEKYIKPTFSILKNSKLTTFNREDIIKKVLELNKELALEKQNPSIHFSNNSEIFKSEYRVRLLGRKESICSPTSTEVSAKSRKEILNYTNRITTFKKSKEELLRQLSLLDRVKLSLNMIKLN